MISPADPRSLCRSLAGLLLGSLFLQADLAAAQALSPADGLTSLPTFAWPKPNEAETSRWAGSYARMSTGFTVVSSSGSGGYAGPTIGFEGGRMWQDGNLVYGVVGGFDYLAAIGGGAVPRFGGFAYTRDFSGALQVKVGTLVAPDVLVYTKVGAIAVHEKLRFGATPSALAFSRDDIAIRPDARVGVEWAVTDRLSVSLEAGVNGAGMP